MDQPIIEISNIGKKYKITHDRGRYISLRDVLANILKRPFAFLKNKARSAVGLEKKEEFWALKDINMYVKKGEVIGIIGHNGAGKSTLLKILSQITPPTEGEIKIRGKIGSLLEVATGFHPELTGRENIFLNGAILGMTRKEIVKKFNEIVEFSGIGKFLDTPVKYYSSGMYVRLAFSVAAHMEPDILLVDEVLAVGDADFQKKCLGKMEEVSQKGGRTILFVSHNMSAIKNLCQKTVLLEKGHIVKFGETGEVIDHYLSSMRQKQKAVYEFEKQPGLISVEKITIADENGIPQAHIPISKSFRIKVDFECNEDAENVSVSTVFYSGDRDMLLHSSDSDKDGKLSDYKKGRYSSTIEIPAFLFNVGPYTFDIMILSSGIGGGYKKGMSFEISNVDNPRRSAMYHGNPGGRIAVQLKYAVNREDTKK